MPYFGRVGKKMNAFLSFFSNSCRLVGQFFKTCYLESFYNAIKKSIGYVKFKLIQHRIYKVRFTSGPIEPIKGLYKREAQAIEKAQKSITAPLNQSISIEGHYTCLHGKEQDFSHATTVVMAHWDPEQIIDAYVEQLCLHFKSLGFKVIITSAQPLKENPVLERWQSFADAIVYRTCPGYDFTSWKAALACFPSLYSCKELVLTNDSCVGPFGSFKNVYTKMDSINCDFWGLTYSTEINPHLQSFYLAIKRNVLQHSCFKDFINAVPLSSNRETAVSFELSFTLWNCLHGFKVASYSKITNAGLSHINPIFYYQDILLKFGVPLLKREKIYTKSGFSLFLESKESFENKAVCDSIHKYILRIGSQPVTASSFCMRHANEAGKITYKQYENFPQSVLPFYTKLASEQMLPEHPSHQIAIVIHCFDTEGILSLIPYLSHIPRSAHVFITADAKEKAEKYLHKIDFEKKEIRLCPATGKDMAPFMLDLKDTLLTYDYVLKLHTKKPKQAKESWRDTLFMELLGTEEGVHNILANFQNNMQLGVIAPPVYPPYALQTRIRSYEAMQLLLAKKGISLPEDACIDFPVGGMFWCRSKALRPWFDLNLSYADFAATNPSQRDGTLAHALERLIFFGCGIEGMQWGRMPPRT